MLSTQYEFGRTYQVKLLALIATVPSFLPSYRDIIKSSYFDGKALVDVCRLSLDYYSKYGSGPTLDAILEAVAELLRVAPDKANQSEHYFDLLEELSAVSLLEKDDVINKAIEFARRQEFCETAMGMVKDIQDGNREGISKAIKRLEVCSQIGTNRTDLGVEYFENFATWDEDRALTCIPTGIPSLDECLGGGLSIGELGVVAAPPNRGKTTFLVNFGVAALRRGYDVVHYSLEMEPAAIRSRFDGCLLGMVRKGATREQMMQRLESIKASVPGKLWIKAWPMKTATPAMITGHFQSLVRDGKVGTTPNSTLVIVDSGYLMRSEQRYGEVRHERASLYQELIRFGKIQRVPVWTGIQGNRFSETKEVVGIEDLAECFEVAMDADVVLGICQSTDELDAGFARVHTAKVREGSRHKIVNVRVDYSKCRIHETTESLVKEDD